MSNDRIHLEVNFEEYITRKLAAQGTWVVSNNDEGFDPNTALYMPDFLAYLGATAPDKVRKMQDLYKGNWEKNLCLNLVKALENDGTVKVIRDGFQMAGFQTITCSGHSPDDPRLPKLKEFYDANILRVMRQVHYQTAGNKSLDLVFFINGIPVATAEVKTELTQTVQDAIEEYQNERKPIEPGTNRKNYLLMYKRGAVVHFAISEDEVWMCTNLESSKPTFLPFNKGTSDGHAGNDPMQPGDEDYPTCYFWNDICLKDNWLRIFHDFVFEEVEKKEDVTGRLREVRTQIFPRFHQWDSVTKVLADVRNLGVGQRYLIEHSAGSGKTETITWVSHELIRLMKDDGNRLFSSVIVVTDRRNLDTNIKATIKQLRKMPGLIAMIGGDDVKKTSGAKNKQLSEALINRSEIIVVTIQTFPFALDAIRDEPSLKDLNFAVIIDEAHSSQGGKVSGKMNEALKYANKKAGKKTGSDDATDEEAINAYFMQQQDAKQLPSNVSFFAFTATPKHETLTLFGRPGSRLDKNGLPIPESFHKYPMRQAIEEHYILDVLRGYLPYETAYRLKDDVVPETMVDKGKALRTIAQWQKLHPTNVMAKAEFIVEHFIKNVAKLLNGQAKAMVVTFSRASVIRYKYAIEGYLRAHPEYDRSKIEPRLQFTVPGDPLVAFSGKVHGEDAVMPEDENVMKEFEYLKDNPFAMIKRDYDYTEENTNKLGYETVEQAFERPENRMMIVADKFQTGYDQPKLCAMYIDKDIANDIEIVQTYSRLNRRHAGKDRVFVVDFRNDPKIVLAAFQKYDNGAEMEEAQNLSVIYDIKKRLDDSDIYTHEEFEAYKVVKYRSMTDPDETKKDSYRTKIYNMLSVPADRWNTARKAQKNAQDTWTEILDKATTEAEKKNAEKHLEEIGDEIKKLDTFKKGLKRYVSAYEYISQVIDLGEPDLEVFCSFARLLSNKLDGMPVEQIDISSLVMSDFRIRAQELPTEAEESKLKPMTAGGNGKNARKESLKAIVEKINEIWGPDTPTATGARTINAIADYVAADDVSRIQIQNTSNSKEAIIADGRMETIMRLAAVSLKNNDLGKLAERIISDPQTWRPLAEVVYDLVDKNKRIDMPELINHLKQN